MTTPHELPEIPKPPPLETRWRRAFRSLRELLDDPEDTAKAIDLFYAIGRRDFERTFQRFVSGPYGGQLLARKPSLADALADRAALARMPEGSLGHAFLDFLDENGFPSLALRDLQRDVEARWEAEEGVPRLDPLRAWFRDRFILSHDLLHVLTGYGTDDVGEATLLAFDLGQRPGRSGGLLTLGAALEVYGHRGWRWLHYDWRAWRRGRRAAFLAELPWEDLLSLRLDTLRTLLRIEPPERAHPDGIWRETLRVRQPAPV